MKINEIAPDIVASGAITDTSIPPDVAAAFEATGDEQRDVPERAMIKVQFAMSGGVLNPVVEHVGDIIHRMTRMGQMADWGLDAAAEKINKTYRWLSHPYGFEREMEGNIQSNAEDLNIPVEQFRQRLDQALKVYADAHARLPVYNRAQYLARAASIQIGQKLFTSATSDLAYLRQFSESSNWKAVAHEFKKDEQGQLLQYPYPRKYLNR